MINYINYIFASLNFFSAYLYILISRIIMAGQKDKLISSELDEGPILKVDLGWNDVYCSHEAVGKPKRDILKGMSGYALSGEFLAIMGTSGAGKTTLLNLISGKEKSSATLKYRGSIAANGQNVEEINYAKYVGYVTQEDVLLDLLTVRESIIFAARLKTSGDDNQKLAKVDHLIQELNLAKCENTLIGSYFVKGVSSGEKKRTCIAIELITSPSILFLDEPTSGLDSYTALQVIDVMNRQAAKGRTVLSTIHQPNSDIYSRFDKLLLLCDGYVMYHGPAKDAVPYFSRLEYACPKTSNPADYFMEILHIIRPEAKSKDEEDRIALFRDSYNSRGKQEFHGRSDYAKLEQVSSKYTATFLVQLYRCTQRAILLLIRNPKLTYFKLVILLFVALLMDVLYFQLNSSTSTENTNDRNGSLFFCVNTLIYANLHSTIVNFPLMREVFLKEYRAKMYGTVAFYLAKNIADFTAEVVLSCVFGAAIFWVIGYDAANDQKPAIFFLLLILIHMSGTSLGLLAGCWFKRLDIALSMGSVVALPFYYFSGYIRSTNSINIGIRWIADLSVFRWGFDGLMLNQYRHNFHHGKDALDEVHIKGETVEECILYLFLIMMSLRIISFIGLRYNATR